MDVRGRIDDPSGADRDSKRRERSLDDDHRLVAEPPLRAREGPPRAELHTDANGSGPIAAVDETELHRGPQRIGAHASASL